jgi:hypothetical protein
MASAKELLERLTIREIVENWALLRDARSWDRMDIHAPRCLNMGAISHGGTIMKKLSMLGIVGGAALLAAVPFSLQWSQGNVGPAVPLLTLSHANAQYYGPNRRHVRRVYRRASRRAYGGYPSPYPSSYGGYPSCLGQYPC